MLTQTKLWQRIWIQESFVELIFWCQVQLYRIQTGWNDISSLRCTFSGPHHVFCNSKVLALDGSRVTLVDG